jgi:hypothetical protein
MAFSSRISAQNGVRIDEHAGVETYPRISRLRRLGHFTSGFDRDTIDYRQRSSKAIRGAQGPTTGEILPKQQISPPPPRRRRGGDSAKIPSRAPGIDRPAKLMSFEQRTR